MLAACYSRDFSTMAQVEGTLVAVQVSLSTCPRADIFAVMMMREFCSVSGELIQLERIVTTSNRTRPRASKYDVHELYRRMYVPLGEVYDPLVEFMYLVFTRMPGESYRRRLRSLLLCICDVFRAALINSLVC